MPGADDAGGILSDRPHLAVGTRLLGRRRRRVPGQGDRRLPSRLSGRHDAGRHQRSVRSRFRAALVDVEALDRTRRYLQMFDVETTEFHYQHHAARAQPMLAFGTRSRARARRPRRLARHARSATGRPACSPASTTPSGSYSRGILRIAHPDRQVIDRTVEALDRHGFRTVFDHAHSDDGLAAVRIVGGLREHLRFFHLVDPAITRKRYDHRPRCQVRRPTSASSAIEDLGLELPMFDITTGTGDFIANGVVSHNCFARKTHEYLDLDAGRDFDYADRGQGQRRRAAAPRTVRAAMARRADRDGHQRRLSTSAPKAATG